MDRRQKIIFSIILHHSYSFSTQSLPSPFSYCFRLYFSKVFFFHYSFFFTYHHPSLSLFSTTLLILRPMADRVMANPVLSADILQEAVPGNIRKAEHFVAFLKKVYFTDLIVSYIVAFLFSSKSHSR